MNNDDLLKEIESLRGRVSQLVNIQARLESTEQALRESEERFGLLCENAPLGYQSINENGFFVGVNKAWLHALGYSRDEVIGKWLGDFVAPEFVDRFRNDFSKFGAAGQGHWFEIDMIKKDGSRITVAVDGQIGRDQWGRFKQIHCILHDMTELKRSHDALKESEERYRRIVETSGEGIWSMDRQSRTTFVNQRIADMLGYSIDQMLCREVDSFLYPEDLGDHESKMRMRRVGRDEFYERRLRRKDGKTVWTSVSATALQDAEGNFAGSFAMFTDITERKNMEDALRESQEQLQAIFQASPAAIFLVNPEGRITFANQRMSILFSRRTEEIVGAPYVELVHPAERTIGYAKMKSLMAGEIDHVSLERRYVDANGREFPGHLSGRRLLGPDGKLTGLVGIITDITERKNAEEALRDSEEKFRALSEATFEAIFLSDEGICIGQNLSAEKLFGYTTEEALGRSGVEWIAPEYRRIVSDNMLSGNEEPYEAVALRKDGTTFPCEIQGKMLTYKGRLIRVTALRDIAERKQARDRLEENEQKFRAIFEGASDGIFVVDPKTRKAVIANDSISQLTGYTLPELMELSVDDIHPPEDLKKVLDLFFRLLEGKIAVAQDTPVLRKDGTIVYCDISSGFSRVGRNELFFGFFRDVTLRKTLENQLRESEKRYRTLFENAGDAIFIIEAEGVNRGQIVLANRLAAAMHG